MKATISTMSLNLEAIKKKAQTQKTSTAKEMLEVEILKQLGIQSGRVEFDGEISEKFPVQLTIFNFDESTQTSTRGMYTSRGKLPGKLQVMNSTRGMSGASIAENFIARRHSESNPNVTVMPAKQESAPAMRQLLRKVWNVACTPLRAFVRLPFLPAKALQGHCGGHEHTVFTAAALASMILAIVAGSVPFVSPIAFLLWSGFQCSAMAVRNERDLDSAIQGILSFLGAKDASKNLL